LSEALKFTNIQSDLPLSHCLLSLRFELICIFAIEILAAVHGADMVVDMSSGLEEDGRFTVWPTPKWEDCVIDGHTAIQGNTGTQGQYFALHLRFALRSMGLIKTYL
jgi:hypothetical protein